MRKYILLSTLAILFSFMKAEGQEKLDTVFFNKKWKKTIKDSALFFRIATKTNTAFEVEDHYMNGVLQMSGYFSSLDPEKKEGPFKYYDVKANLTSEGMYESGKKEGEWKYFDSLGQVRSLRNYSNGKFHAESTFYHKNGIVKRVETYRYDELVKGSCYTASGQDTAFYPYAEKPAFIGGQDAYVKYINEHIVYPDEARRKKIQGRVIVQFIVDKKGGIDSVHVTQGIYPPLDKAAMKLVKDMPSWLPGKRDGIPVRYTTVLPILFKL